MERTGFTRQHADGSREFLTMGEVLEIRRRVLEGEATTEQIQRELAMYPSYITMMLNALGLGGDKQGRWSEANDQEIRAQRELIRDEVLAGRVPNAIALELGVAPKFVHACLRYEGLVPMPTEGRRQGEATYHWVPVTEVETPPPARPTARGGTPVRQRSILMEDLRQPVAFDPRALPPPLPLAAMPPDWWDLDSPAAAPTATVRVSALPVDDEFDQLILQIRDDLRQARHQAEQDTAMLRQLTNERNILASSRDALLKKVAQLEQIAAANIHDAEKWRERKRIEDDRKREVSRHELAKEAASLRAVLRPLADGFITPTVSSDGSA